MKKLKISFLTCQVISEREYKRFSLDFLENNHELIIFDFTQLLQPKAFQQQFNSRKRGLKTIFINNSNQLSNNVKYFQDSDLIISILGTINELNSSIFKFLKPYQQKVCLTYISSFPLYPLNLKYYFLKKIYSDFRREGIFFIKNKLKKCIYLLKKKLTSKINFKSGYLIVNGENLVEQYAKNEYQNTRIYKTCSYDYVLTKNIYENLFDYKYVVFLDEYIIHHTDLKILNMKFDKEDIYYRELNSFFDHIEKSFKLKVIIASHPRSNLEFNKSKFPGYKVFKGNTVQLVKYSEYVILHASTSINFAVIFSKPILFITTNRMKIYRFDNELLASWFNRKPLNISKKYNKDLIIRSFSSEKKYNEQYFKNFISPSKDIEFGFKPLIDDILLNK